jgi:hypothetical protein
MDEMTSQGTMSQPLAQVARLLQQKGRNGDTILAHISPDEARHLKDHGGSGTRNPETGLLEFRPIGLAGRLHDLREHQDIKSGETLDGGVKSSEEK